MAVKKHRNDWVLPGPMLRGSAPPQELKLCNNFTLGFRVKNGGQSHRPVSFTYENDEATTLPTLDLSLMQWISSTVLTLASLTIAYVAVTFGYRQNYGWPPVLLVLSHGVGGLSGEEDYVAHVDFEFWNRRKYPVIVHFVEMKFGNLTLGTIPEQSPSGESARWYIFHNKLIQREHVGLDPASRHLFEPRVPFKRQPLDDLTEIVKIDVFYFDPIANKRKKLTTKYRFRIGQED